MAAPVNMAKFLYKLIQNTKDEPARVAKKLNAILHHMRSSGKENSMPFQVISRALESLIMQHDLRDLSLNSSSQVALSSGMDEAATKIKQPKNISLPDVGYDMTTESLPKEQLAEPQDETYTLQRIPDLDMDLIWEDCNAGKNKGTENSSIYVINKTCTEETSEGKKPEKGISYEILSEHFGKPLADAAESFHDSYSVPCIFSKCSMVLVSRSTFKRMCRDHGITRWKSSKRRMGSHSSSKHRTVNDDELSMNSSLMVIPPLQDTAVIALPQTSQDMNKINVKATYKGTAFRFELLDSSGMTELEDLVIERLKLKRHTFSIKYQDDEGDWVLIACDNDVQKCIEISRSLKNAIIKMLVDPPISD